MTVDGPPSPPDNFLALEDPYATFETARVLILPVPLEATVSWRGGTAVGPRAIIEASQQVELYDREHDGEPALEYGIHTLPALTLSDDPAVTLAEIAAAVAEAASTGRLVVVLGGEHTISAGVNHGLLDARGGPLTVVQLDAHSDLRDSYDGTPFSHACVARRILEDPRVEQVLQLGVRSVDAEEVAFARANEGRVRVWYAEDVHDGGWREEFVARVRGRRIHLTIDVDGLDPAIVPATGHARARRPDLARGAGDHRDDGRGGLDHRHRLRRARAPAGVAPRRLRRREAALQDDHLRHERSLSADAARQRGQGLHRASLPPLQLRRADRRGARLPRPAGRRRQHVPDDGGRDEHGRARPLAGRDDPRRTRSTPICCTGANLEEDVYNLVAHDHYVRVPNYRELTPRDEQDLLERHLNRVTDTCIPEEEAIRRIEEAVLDEWTRRRRRGRAALPARVPLPDPAQRAPGRSSYQIDPADSWLVAACERDLPIFVPGWEDSTSGNIFTSHCLKGTIANVHTVRTGIEYMMELTAWYQAQSARAADRLLSDRRRDRGRLPDLRRADAAPGHGARRHAAVELLLPDLATRRRATARTPARCPTRRSRGKSWRSTRRGS